MLLKYIIVIVLTFYVIHAEGDSESILKGSQDILKKQHGNIQDTLHEKFKKLEKSIIDTLEEYLDGKINMLQKNINRRIDSLEENIPDKTVIFNIERDLEALKNGSKSCGSSSLENVPVAEINTKLYKIQNDISKLEQTVTSVTNIEDNLNQIKIEVQRVVEKVIKPELDTLNKKIPENFEENSNLKLGAVEKQIVEFSRNVSEEFNKLENRLSYKLDNVKNGISFLEQNMYITLDPLRNSSNEQSPVDNDYSHCQKRKVLGYDYEPINIDTLNHTTVQHDSNGLSRFEMHLAIKGLNTYTHILLSPKENPSEQDTYIALDFYNAAATVVRSASPNPNSSDAFKVIFHEQLAKTGGIELFSSSFATTYLKINDGVLTMGLIGSPPVIRYEGSKLREIKYIGFTAWYTMKAEFLYDCPAGFEGTSYYKTYYLVLITLRDIQSVLLSLSYRLIRKARNTTE